MKKRNVIEEIALEMRCIPEWCFDEKEYVSDETILKKIESIEDLEQTDREGRTLLFHACLCNRKSIVEYLIAHHANVNTKDKVGYTPLHIAAQEKRWDILKLLLDHGADVNAQDMYGNNPIMVFDFGTPKEGFEILMSYGADPYQKNNYGIAAVDQFLAKPEILEMLQKKKK